MSPIAERINGDTILYHYLQKDLLKADIWLFQMLCSRLVRSLGIWLHPDVYRRMPIILPFAVREPCRQQPAEGDSKRWGYPTSKGYVRDSNLLVKDIVRRMTVVSEGQPLYHGKRIGPGFVASHIWRWTTEAHGTKSRTVKNWLTYSFVANLVWLPANVARLSDREGTFAQQYLQALSAKIYRDIEVAPSLRPFTESAWSMLRIPEGIPEQGLPDLRELSFVVATEEQLAGFKQNLAQVVEAIRCVLAGDEPTGRVITPGYASALSSVPREELANRERELSTYLEAIEEAWETSTSTE